MLVCVLCKKTKNPSEFGTRTKLRNGKINPTGKRTYCKQCESEKQKIYHLKSKEKRNASSRDYYQKNKEQIIQDKIKKAKEKRKTNPGFDYNREYQRKYNRRKKYGLRQEQYNTMLKNQNSTCAICKLEEEVVIKGCKITLSVDHCHETGKIRGLLCRKCNSGLGHFNDSIELLEKAINYLNSFKT